ncbi:MAG: ribbon-helix-helix protein, CopG family [Nitrospira sp.]|nr:ribbon-helix-helix protein, CopG family [Nitrospira sp.]
MIKRVNGIAIRTAFNNNGWVGSCKNPKSDYRCFKCVKGELLVNFSRPINEDDEGNCKGEISEDYPLSEISQLWCWEQNLCKKYYWGNLKGQWRFAIVGMPVYFFYTEYDRTLTLWGHSHIERIDNNLSHPTLFFTPFNPLPDDKWIKGLSGKEITGAKWGQGFFRYLDEQHEKYLKTLIEGNGKREIIKKTNYILESSDTINIKLNRDIQNKLEKIANNEGRDISDLIREAVAKLIRDRGF